MVDEKDADDCIMAAVDVADEDIFRFAFILDTNDGCGRSQGDDDDNNNRKNVVNAVCIV